MASGLSPDVARQRGCLFAALPFAMIEDVIPLW